MDDDKMSQKTRPDRYCGTMSKGNEAQFSAPRSSWKKFLFFHTPGCCYADRFATSLGVTLCQVAIPLATIYTCTGICTCTIIHTPLQIRVPMLTLGAGGVNYTLRNRDTEIPAIAFADLDTPDQFLISKPKWARAEYAPKGFIVFTYLLLLTPIFI